MLPEYEAKYFNRYYGKRRARVAINNDPRRLGRIKVECPDLFGNGLSDWAMPNFPFYGGRDSGFVSIPPIGSMVWIECEEGFIDHIIYTGGFFDEVDDGHKSDGSLAEEDNEYQEDPSTVPAHAKGFYDGSDSGGLKGNYNVPATSFEGKYPHVTVLQTPSGHMFEMDDTEGAERVQIHHKSGSHVEILPDGTVHIISTSKILTRSSFKTEYVDLNKEVTVGGDQVDTIVGSKTTTIGGDVVEIVYGDVTSEYGSVSANLSGALSIDSSSILTNVAGLLDISVGGDTSINCFNNLDIVSNGTGFISFNNTVSIPESPYIDSALSLVASNGTARLISGDPTLEVSAYGIESRGGAGGQVYIGALTTAFRTPTLAIGPVPLAKENAVCGFQLLTFLQTVMTTLNTFLGACTSPPAVPPAAATALTALTTAQTTFLTTPSPTQPLILSEVVYVSKV
jgi:hypothetical protein